MAQDSPDHGEQDGRGDGTAGRRGESGDERADRNLLEELQELRVALAGVQILFAFLLTLAFMERFPADDDVFAGVLTAALLTSVVATLCLLAPVVVHRTYFRQGAKEEVVWLTQWLALAGLTLVVAAMALAVWLVIAFLWSKDLATGLAIGVALTAGIVWLVVPRLAVGAASHR